jgi:predicted GNAT family N-acyltransferase
MTQVADKVEVMRVPWQEQEEHLKTIRYKVFVEEQQVPLEMELDELDPAAEHFLVRYDGKLVATGRITRDGQIGRMAVLRAFRNQGVGSQLLKAMINFARGNGFKRLQLHAQVRAIPFYTRHGFHVSGETFMEAGIAHRHMERPCNE